MFPSFSNAICDTFFERKVSHRRYHTWRNQVKHQDKNAVNVVRHRWAATSSKWISLQGQVCWTLIPQALRRIGMAIFRISLPDFSSALLTWSTHLIDFHPTSRRLIKKMTWVLGFVLLKLCTVKFKRCLNHWPVRVVAMSVLRSKVHVRSHSDKLLQARGCWGGILFMNYRNHEIVWINELFLFFHRHSVA